jgi:hypothetical protein
LMGSVRDFVGYLTLLRFPSSYPRKASRPTVMVARRLKRHFVHFD